MKRFLFIAVMTLCGALGFSSVVAANQPADTSPARKETKAHRDERMAWWREAKFGMFIHWGLYSVPAGYYHGKPVPGAGEWIMHNAKIPIAEYAAFAPQFDPTKFDADAWVKTAKAAGMKYIVITAKHHEGFAMFHTKVDGYNIYDATPFKRDPIAELAKACKKVGVKFGLYYSQNLDWHHPGGGGNDWDPAHQGDPELYVKNVVVPQVR
jgi:alpha-L-fucosidase